MLRSRSQIRIITIAGPKGGIGRTTCAIVMARALASRDRRVLVVDLSPCGAMSSCLDLPVPQVQCLSGFRPIHTRVPALDYACLECENALELIAGLRELDSYDDVILDLQAGDHALSSELFLRADMPILMADPEPESIRMASCWLRKTFIRYLARFSETGEIVDLLNQDARVWTFQSIWERLSLAQRSLFQNELQAFRCAFLLNNRRENSEDLQGRALCHAYGIHLGLPIQYVGSLSYDDRRWFFSRGLADVSLFMREDPLVREMDALNREVIQSMSFGTQNCLALTMEYSQPRQFLGVTTPEEARQAYRILWEGYRRENGMVAQIMDKAEITAMISRLETAYRRSEIAPEAEVPAVSVVDVPAVTRDLSNTFAAVKSYSPENCGDSAGEWLRVKREATGMTLGQLSLKTRISSRVLEKLESQKFEEITPTRLQAYLFEVAKALGISFEEVKTQFGLE